MDIHPVAFLFLAPFAGVFGYAAWHEISRYKSEGRSTYGLSYDPETNTTYVSALGEDEDGFDPEDFDPEATEASGDDAGAEEEGSDTARARRQI